MRAQAGFGEQTLKGIARQRVKQMGHRNLGQFTRTPTGWEARCKDCLSMVIINKVLKVQDGIGIGGTATKKRCPEAE